jgi:deoxyribodipyrimidine photo-lyase
MSGGKTATASAPTSSNTNASKRVVLWFRNDLRLHDNAIIDAAVRKVQSGAATEVLPVYCFDPRWFSTTSFESGMLKTGPYRAQFLLESVLDLKTRLRGVGSDLLITMGPPEKVLPNYTGQQTLVLAQSEVTSEETRAERAVKSALKANGSKLELYWGSTLFHIDDLPFKDLENLSDMPDVFTPFKQKCEDRSQVRKCFLVPKPGSLPLPSSESFDVNALSFQPKGIEELNNNSVIVGEKGPWLVPPIRDPRAAMVFHGGESAALDRLKYYLWESNLIADYFSIRNGMLGEKFSTKLSAALAHGCISPRYIYSEVKRYESEREANKSTYWVIFELIWRDYFKFFAFKHGDKIFHLDGTAGRSSGTSTTWSTSVDLLTRWKEGTTGWPLVDANMRELAATGWMSNRGRQNVASFLALDLGIDWRIGADWFESLLMDYDPASNWGNWMAAAGVNGGRVNKFNITKQSKDYDANGDYIRHWIPELGKVPASRIHEPWLMSKAEQETYGVQIGVDYPHAIPSSAFDGRGNGDGRSGGGRGGGRGRGGHQSRFSNGSSVRQGGGGGGGNKRNFRPKSEFEMYG